MAKCERCGGVGYLESFYHYGAYPRRQVKQCCDIKAYSERVALINGTPEDAFKSLGKKEPFIGRAMNVTHKGIEFKGVKADHISINGRREPCPVIPLSRK